tara:strand:- start:9505 stop:9708 length:204 start_codon:yes stop_codon:yes gene_type:complete
MEDELASKADPAARLVARNWRRGRGFKRGIGATPVGMAWGRELRREMDGAMSRSGESTQGKRTGPAV